MKIYIVTSSSYADIGGVFSTQEKAEAFFDTLDEPDLHIEEYELDQHQAKEGPRAAAARGNVEEKRNDD
jgi:hypothetical protein